MIFAEVQTHDYASLPPAERARLHAAFEAGFCTGAGCSWRLPRDLDLIALMDAVSADWFRQYETIQSVAALDFPPLTPEALPAWLRAARERLAIEQQPPEGWPI